MPAVKPAEDIVLLSKKQEQTGQAPQDTVRAVFCFSEWVLQADSLVDFACLSSRGVLELGLYFCHLMLDETLQNTQQ